MFKPIPKSDITVRPFKVFKNWTFNEDTINLHAIQHREGAFEDYEGFNLYGSGSNYDFSYAYNEYATDRSIRAMFYNNAPKLVAVVTNWNLSKHKAKKQRYYIVQNVNDITNASVTYEYYYDSTTDTYIDEFQSFLDNNGYIVSDKGQILTGNYTDITKMYGSMNSLGSVQERQIGSRFFLWNIPNKFIGEGIKPGSFKVVDYGRKRNTKGKKGEYITIVDDGKSNLIDNSRDFLGLIELDFSGSYASGAFSGSSDTGSLLIRTTEGLDYTMNLFELDFGDDIVDGDEVLTYQYANDREYDIDIRDIDEIDAGFGFMYADGDWNLPYPIQNPRKSLGNIFYANGIATVTWQTGLTTGSGITIEGINYDFGSGGYQMSFQSTKTIYENELFLEVKPNEFNISTNPSATTFYSGALYVNKYIENKPSALGDSGSFFDLDFRIKSEHVFNYTSSWGAPGTSVTRSMGFDEYEYSSSLDRTGSYLAPYITTVGLYDENMDLVAVAKLPSKPKSTPDYPVNIVVRFDT
jgi:hypothetical protein